MEVVRDRNGQLHHRLLDREPRSDGRAHRRLDHRRAGADADRQGIPAHARRLDRGAAQDRRRMRRLERAVRAQPDRRPHARHRDESARVALLGARVEGDRLPDREGRGEARRRLHARRAAQRHHRRRDAGVVRADDRLRRHQDSALRVREIPGRQRPPDDADEVGRRGDGDRPHVPGVAAEGAARPGDRHRRARSDAEAAARRRASSTAARRAAHAGPGPHALRRRRVPRRAAARRSARAVAHRSVVPRADRGPRPRRAGGRRRRASKRSTRDRVRELKRKGFSDRRLAHAARHRRDQRASRAASRSASVRSTSASTPAPPSSPPRPRTCTRPTRRSARRRRPTARRS